MKTIVSSDNSFIKDAEKLKQKKYRDRENRYLIEGIHLAEEALSAGALLESVYFRSASLSDESSALWNLAERVESMGVPTARLADPVFDRLSETETPKGVLSVVQRNEWTLETFFQHRRSADCSNVLILDRIQDPGNVGTMIRTADGAAFLGIIAIKGTADIYGSKVVRAASGSLFRLPFLFLETAEEAIEILRQQGKRILVATPYGAMSCFETKMDRDVGLVIGNEGGGPSQIFLDQGDQGVTIPMEEAVDSLNAAVAAGVLMFETVRQNRIKP